MSTHVRMKKSMHLQRFIIVSGLALGLATGGVASAQQTINADGNSGAANSGINPAVDADGPTVVYGDLDVGPGNNVIGVPSGPAGNITATDGNASTLGPGNASASPGTVTRGTSGTDLLGPDGTYSVSDTPPSDVSVGDNSALAPAPEPVYDTPVETVDSAPVDTAIASDTDMDGDNYPDAQELEVGLDPANSDTDGDGVADGDEVNIYGTDPWSWDTDGDGRGDGDELYNTRTDPLAWDGDGSEVASTGTEELAATEDVAATDLSTAESSAIDSDGDRLADADEAAIGTDPNNPDSDGDGYYDGDEAALGSDPFDPVSIPTT